jgi:hypothetical protein
VLDRRTDDVKAVVIVEVDIADAASVGVIERTVEALRDPLDSVDGIEPGPMVYAAIGTSAARVLAAFHDDA